MNWTELIGLLLGGTSIVSVIGAIIYFKPRMKTENLSAKILSTDSCVSLITSNPDLPGSIGDMIMAFMNK